MLDIEKYKEFSRWVYRIDEKHEEFNLSIQDSEFLVIDNVDYKIIKLESNQDNGMQAMAVAPIIDNEVDTSEVIIAYAGTNFKDINDLETDIQTVILGNKDTLKKAEIDNSGFIPTFQKVEVDSQIVTAEKFADDIKQTYPDATIITTGHSLGEYIALYIAAENGWRNIGFNGPDPYDILSEDAKKWIEENPGMLINFRNRYDLIGNYGGNGTGAQILIDMDMGNSFKDTFAFHQLGTWEFADTGEIKINELYANKDARLDLAEKLLYWQLAELQLLGTRGSGLSSNETIYIQYEQALLIANHFMETIRIGLQYVTDIYRDGMAKSEDIWTSGIELAQSIGSELTYSEIIGALAAEGVTKNEIVHIPVENYYTKILEAKGIEASFKQLIFSIEDGIEQLHQTDREIATQIERGVVHSG